MSNPPPPSPDTVVGDHYGLQTGEAGARRLRILDDVYGPATRQLLTEIGVGPGWRVADFGCGIGSVSLWLAQQVGPTGKVDGIDAGPAQLAIARQRATKAGLTNVTFTEASASASGLCTASVDLACTRLLLNHVKEPGAVLWELMRVVRPGGWIVCEETDIMTLIADPPSEAYRRFVSLGVAYSEHRNSHSRLGPSLHRLFRVAGLEPTVRFSQPIHMHGDERRLWELTYLEMAPAILAAGLIGQDELASLSAELTRDTDDETRLIAPPMMVQVWGKRP